jgi:hypothetical protein
MGGRVAGDPPETAPTPRDAFGLANCRKIRTVSPTAQLSLYMLEENKIQACRGDRSLAPESPHG